MYNPHSCREAGIQSQGRETRICQSCLIRHLRTDKLSSMALDAFGTSLFLTLRAAKLCKSAILPICPAIHSGMTALKSQ